jgi:GNAT superfamily N-acetyltransferase
MASYRFCRSDDIPLLVDAHNRCCAIHPDGQPLLTVERFKQAINELNVWSSSCSVAVVDGEPVGVVLATKRARATLIHRIGVLPQYQRQGHGMHLLTSLSNKLAILGPPRLEVELPVDRTDLAPFFLACGYQPVETFSDFHLDRAGPVPAAAELAIPVGLDDIVGSGAWSPEIPRSWERTLPTLENRKDQLEGLAVASDTRIEAWLLHFTPDPAGPRQVVALGTAPGEQPRSLLAILMARCAGESTTGLTLPRVSRGEIDYTLLEDWGFRRTRSYQSYAADPVAG